MSYSVPEKFLYTSCANDYETSNMKDYQGVRGEPAPKIRPSTSNFPTDTITGKTGYQEDFSWKNISKEDVGRPGTSSGERKNNPHPKETFLVWKFSDRQDTKDQKFGEELMQEIRQDKMKSTYEVDYMGLQQGESKPRREIYQKYTVMKNPEGRQQTRTLATTSRVDYQTPDCHLNLNGNTKRFGLTDKMSKRVNGVVPAVKQQYPLSIGRYATSYTDQFGNNDGNHIAVNDQLIDYIKSGKISDEKTKKPAVYAVPK